MLEFMSHIKPFVLKIPLWTRVRIFLTVLSIHTIYLQNKRCSKGLILQETWQWEEFVHLDAHSLSQLMQVPLPTQAGPIISDKRSFRCLFALFWSCGVCFDHEFMDEAKVGEILGHAEHHT